MLLCFFLSFFLSVIFTQVQMVFSCIAKFNNLLTFTDPILSCLTFAVLWILAGFVSLALCVFTPSQVGATLTLSLTYTHLRYR